MATKDTKAQPAAEKPARKRKTPEEQLAELEQKRKQLEIEAAAVKARASLDSAIAKLREHDFDGAVEAAQHACRVMQPHVTIKDIDAKEYGDTGSR